VREEEMQEETDNRLRNSTSMAPELIASVAPAPDATPQPPCF
jgi:hypothetical protein